MADRAALLVQQNVPVSAELDAACVFSADSDANSPQLTVKSASAHGKIRSHRLAGISGAVLSPMTRKFRDAISDMARDANAWIVAGAIGSDAPRSPMQTAPIFNSAALVSPTGEWTARYDKVHLVPFGEYLPFPSLFSFAGGLTKEVGQFRARHIPIVR